MLKFTSTIVKRKEEAMQNEMVSNNPKITRIDLMLFFLLIAVVAFANGLSDSILANFFKDAYEVNAAQRAFIEFPREFPGILCTVIISSISFLGDFKIAVIAQIFSCIGVMVLGIFSPSFTVMLIFLFVYSTGMHIFLPLQDSLGMALAEPDKIGKRMGHYGSIKTAFGCLAGILAFIGFRFGFFSFKTELKMPFIISGIAFVFAIIIAIFLYTSIKDKKVINKSYKTKFVFKSKYKYYYLLAILHGVQKQIAIVFGSWVIIDILLKGADVMSILLIISSFIGVFFFRYVGHLLDSRGIRFMMFFDAFTFIIIYAVFGFVVWGILDNWFVNTTFYTIIIYILFILDRLSMQVGVVKSVYIREIADTPQEVTSVLSTGVSLDHVVSIFAAQISGLIWMSFGAQWVFFLASLLSLGNLFVAIKIPKK